MKFKKQDHVEVLRRQDESNGVWFPAIIISVTGHDCTVMFEHLPAIGGEKVMEKVHLDDVRPCPPLLVNERKWACGDQIEVFDLHSWRIGKVVNILDKDMLIVGLPGSMQPRKFDSSLIRVPQAWKHNKWFRAEKVNEEKPISRISFKPHSKAGAEHQSCVNKKCYRSSLQKMSSPRHAKREGGFWLKLKSSPGGDMSTNFKKQKVDSGCCHLRVGPPSKEVNGISFPKRELAKNHLHPTIKNNINPCEFDVRSEYTSGYTLQQASPHLQVTEEKAECSVASCSGNFISGHPFHDSFKSCRDVKDCPLEDDESSCPLEPRKKNFPFAKGNVEEKVHLLELRAYICTVNALYASGPLSWEQESLLTNLRIFLHISNEEHLVQLRNLLSA